MEPKEIKGIGLIRDRALEDLANTSDEEIKGEYREAGQDLTALAEQTRDTLRDAVKRTVEKRDPTKPYEDEQTLMARRITAGAMLRLLKDDHASRSAIEQAEQAVIDNLVRTGYLMEGQLAYVEYGCCEFDVVHVHYSDFGDECGKGHWLAISPIDGTVERF